MLYLSANLPTRYRRGGPLRIDVAALRRMHSSPFVGIGGDVTGVSRRRIADEIIEAEEWNEAVEAGLVVRDENGRLASGIPRNPVVQQAMSDSRFAERFQFGVNARQREHHGEELAQAMFQGVQIAMTVIPLVLASPIRGRGVAATPRWSGFVSVLRDQLRIMLARLQLALRRLIPRQRIRPLNGRINVAGGFEPGSESASNLQPFIGTSGPGRNAPVPNLVRGSFEEISSFSNPTQPPTSFRTVLSTVSLWIGPVQRTGRIV